MRNKAQGSVLVELAIVVPLLTLLAFGTYDYGRNLNIHQGVERILYEVLRQTSLDKRISEEPMSAPNTWTPATFSNFYDRGNEPNTLYKNQCQRGLEAVCRALELTFRNYGDKVRLGSILLDYDITRNEPDEDDNIAGLGTGTDQRCSRTIRGEIRYTISGPSFFRPILGGTVTARVPYFKVGPNEEGVRCSLN